MKFLSIFSRQSNLRILNHQLHFVSILIFQRLYGGMKMCYETTERIIRYFFSLSFYTRSLLETIPPRGIVSPQTTRCRIGNGRIQGCSVNSVMKDVPNASSQLVISGAFCLSLECWDWQAKMFYGNASSFTPVELVSELPITLRVILVVSACVASTLGNVIILVVFFISVKLKGNNRCRVIDIIIASLAVAALCRSIVLGPIRAACFVKGK